MQVVFADTNGSMSNFKEIKTYTDGQFTDVSSADWFAENVKKAYELGLISGTSETTFSPDSDLTYAETITLASRIHNIYSENNYEFKSTTPWYQTYYDYYKTYIYGMDYEGTTIIPFIGENHEKSIHRGHFVMYLYWALPESEFEAINNILPGSLPDVEQFEDYNAIYAFYNAGILSGSDEYGTFNQFSPIKRSEVSAIITRIVDKSLRKEFELISASDKLQASAQTNVQKQDLEISDLSIKLVVPNQNSENSYAYFEICNYSDSDIVISSEYVTIAEKLWYNGLRPMTIKSGTSIRDSVTLNDRRIRSDATCYLNEECEAHIELEWKDKSYIAYFNSYGISKLYQINKSSEKNPYEFKALDNNSINDLLDTINKYR